jgi:catechol 2,3-dioxygenase-like lactoylglutathione lyase family enzyme
MEKSAMRILALDHVQLAIPRGEEERARAFYGTVLGLTEVPKPPHLARRGGIWYAVGSQQLHLGVEDTFLPARKAHPALLVEGLAALAARCREAGYEPAVDEPLPGYDRFYVSDPFGNRIELLEKVPGAARK